MSKKRGETKMIDVPPNGQLLVCDLTKNIEPDYSGFAALGKRAAQDRVNVVLDAILDDKKPQPRARSRTFVAKPCSVCQALREPDTNFTRVYASRGNIRYCRCSYCGNTWKDQG